jgi:hypothetical protein
MGSGCRYVSHILPAFVHNPRSIIIVVDRYITITSLARNPDRWLGSEYQTFVREHLEDDQGEVLEHELRGSIQAFSFGELPDEERLRTLMLVSLSLITRRAKKTKIIKYF